jgi:hypothetical protein
LRSIAAVKVRVAGTLVDAVGVAGAQADAVSNAAPSATAGTARKIQFLTLMPRPVRVID